MNKKYFIYTILNGFSYIICHTEAKGFYVDDSPADSEVFTTDFENAEKIAKQNSNASVTYKTKAVGEK